MTDSNKQYLQLIAHEYSMFLFSPVVLITKSGQYPRGAALWEGIDGKQYL